MNARIAILLLLGFLLSASSTHAQDTLVVSERVGKVLDSTERAYFRLFPGISRFEGVAFFQKGDSITIENGGVRYSTISQSLYNELGKYISQYDNLLWSLRVSESTLTLNRHFRPLQDALLIAPILDWKGSEVKLEVKEVKALRVVEYEGELLWAGKHEIILLPDDARTMAECDTIPAGDVLALILYKGNSGSLGAFIGGLIGGLTGYALSQITPHGSASYHGDEPGFVVPSTLIGAAVGAGIGALIGGAGRGKEYVKLENSSDYLVLLPKLQQHMFYRNGLPPDSPWREK